MVETLRYPDQCPTPPLPFITYEERTGFSPPFNQYESVEGYGGWILELSLPSPVHLSDFFWSCFRATQKSKKKPDGYVGRRWEDMNTTVLLTVEQTNEVSGQLYSGVHMAG